MKTTNLKKMTVPTITINGHSTINHNLRVKLRLNCSEYVMMDFLHNQKIASKVPDIQDCYKATGFSENEQKAVLTKLIEKGMLINPDKFASEFIITDKWLNVFTSVEKEFEEFFWLKDGKKCWTGSKPQAKKNFVFVRKNYELDFLISQRDWYFLFLEECEKKNFFRQKMMCSVFLGPQERFLEDWKEQYEKLAPKKKEPAKKISMKDLQNLYENEKDSNE